MPVPLYLDVQVDKAIHNQLHLRGVDVLQTWMDEEDPQEQKETFEYLLRALDEDRPSQRKLFPPELKGISW